MRYPGSRSLALSATVAAVAALGAGVALAQKSPTPQQPPPGIQAAPQPGKPPAGTPAPAPQPPRMVTPAPAPGGKPPVQGQLPTRPPAPPAPPPVATVPPQPTPGGKPGATPPQAQPPAQPPAIARPAQPAPPAAPIPPNEPATVSALRQLLPPGVQLRYGAAEVVDAATGRTRLTQVVLSDSSAQATIEEAVLEQIGPQGAGAVALRNIVVNDTAATPTRVSIASFEMRNLVLRQPAGSAPADPSDVDLGLLRLTGMRMEGEVTMALASLEIEGWGGGRLTRIEASGFEIGGPPRNAPFDRMAVGRLLLSGIDLQAIAAAALSQRPAPPVTGEQVFEMADIALTMRGAPVASVASIGGQSRTDAAGAGAGQFAIRDIRVGAVGELAPWLQRFGYQDIRGELTIESRYDQARGRIEVTEFRIAATDVGALSLAFLMEGLTQEALAARDYSRIRFLGGRIGWLDQSILERAVRNHAASVGQQEQQVRQGWAALASMGLDPRNAPRVQAIRDAVTGYILGRSREIEIVSRPSEPVGAQALDRLASPAAAAEALGLSATAR